MSSGSGPLDLLDLVVRGRRVLLPDGEGAAEVGVRDGRVVAVEPPGTGLTGAQVVDLADDEVLLPGLVDAHVHVNEPGRTHWEGFATATRAAAAGGVTTIVDMPLNAVPPTVDVTALALKRDAAAPQVHVDVAFWGGAVPGNAGDLAGLHEEGVVGVKCFLLDSGVEEFPPLSVGELDAHLAEVARLDSLLIAHAEDADEIAHAPQRPGPDYRDFLASRPARAEDVAISHLLDATRRTGARTHVVHLSSSDALPQLRRARAEGLDVTAETCPHYLTLAAEDVPDGATAYKCCPPIRDAANADRLWEALLDGTLAYVASDHSPATPELKQPEDGDFAAAWGGISSVQLMLPVVWTEARRRGIDLARVVGWMSAAPADRVGLPGKGRIAVDADADLVVLAPDEAFTVDATRLRHRHAVTPYDGATLHGVVRRTWVRGTEVDDEPRGRLLRRGERVR
ncbi:allantoinase AllB [uncultured Nocardioides sp.]|uniref:allantoinase AllB n=1 Tax=uncultured Nocardioides sp. TaxID=198441 RepID=UPI00262A188D|nr:allantoinase AllB [uncultured Nocardioides sp.]